MIITYGSNSSDWQWLRIMFDKYKYEYLDMHHLTAGSGYGETASKYAAEKVLSLTGTQTQPFVILESLTPGHAGTSYRRRNFKVVDKDTFMMAKLSRKDDDYNV